MQPIPKNHKPSSARQRLVWMLGFLLFTWGSFAACPGPPALPEGGQEATADGQGQKESSTSEAPTESVQDTSEPATTDAREPSVSPDEATPTEPPAEQTTQEAGPEPAPDASEPGIEPGPETTNEATPEASPEQAPDNNATDTVVTDQPPGSTIGNPCTQDSDCGSQPYRCVPEQGTPSFPFPGNSGKGPPGGYCTQSCFIGSGTCPKGSACYVPGAASGVCLKECTTDKECRTSEGYTCTFEAGTNTKLCLPPVCSRTAPGGSYDATLGASSSRGTCSGNPLPSGTKLFLSVTIQSNTIRVEFGSKPGSPLPVTWSLTGSYQGLNQQFTATNPANCSQNCDGLLKGAFLKPCNFNGTLEIQSGSNCWYSYDATFTPR
ncbi:MAG: hypothetical protein EP343_01505 [Deltaproteobacteria bacterium]|nr:MAG: hypothetical protein EP343_01505 [Deltaproteobacteria bacterium]